MWESIKQHLKSRTIRVALVGLVIPVLDQLGPSWMSGFMSPGMYAGLAVVYPILMTYLRKITTEPIKDK